MKLNRNKVNGKTTSKKLKIVLNFYKWEGYIKKKKKIFFLIFCLLFIFILAYFLILEI